MRRDIWGNIMQEPKDFSNLALADFDSQPFNAILPKLDTLKGFSTSQKEKIPESGLYVIYKFEQPIYVGYATKSIRSRIARFLAAVRGTEREDETHPAGYKYNKVYKDLDALSIKTCSMEFDKILPSHINIEDVEKEVIYNLRPVFNSQIYKSIFIGDTLINNGEVT